MGCKYRNTCLIYMVNLYIMINIKISISWKHFSFHLLCSESNVQIYSIFSLKQFLKSGVCEIFERKQYSKCIGILVYILL